jgi:hypothetical protein
MGHATDVAIGEGAVWVTEEEPGFLVRIDPTTNSEAARIEVGEPSGGVATGAGSVWIGYHDLPGGVVMIDPRINQELRGITLESRPTDVAVGEGVVWAVAYAEGVAFRIPLSASPDQPASQPGSTTMIYQSQGAALIEDASNVCPTDSVVPASGDLNRLEIAVEAAILEGSLGATEPPLDTSGVRASAFPVTDDPVYSGFARRECNASVWDRQVVVEVVLPNVESASLGMQTYIAARTDAGWVLWFPFHP